MDAKTIYLDYNATTPVDPRVLESMLPYFTERFGNAASRSHFFGYEAARAAEQAREQVADLVHASPQDIVWTSGATESNNLAIKGVARMHRDKGRHIITQVTEHKSVLDPCRVLEREGFKVTYLPVSRVGRVSADQIRDAIRPGTVLVSIMFANNEIGTVQPIGEIAGLCKRSGIFFHTDATQAFGKIPIDVDVMNIDLLSCSAHKVYGPKGMGALYVRGRRPRVRCEPLIHGGGHERGMRSGTLNTTGIVGLGVAAEIAGREMAEESSRLAELRDGLEQGLRARLTGICRNGDSSQTLPGTLNLSFADVNGEKLLEWLSDVAVTNGSACTSASREASHVLRALGVEERLARSSIRFSLGRFTTLAEIEHTIEQVSAAVRGLRSARGVRATHEFPPATKS